MTRERGERREYKITTLVGEEGHEPVETGLGDLRYAARHSAYRLDGRRGKLLVGTGDIGLRVRTWGGSEWSRDQVYI